MKKSEIYLKAQAAVLACNMSNLDKLTILRELMHQEDVALYVEKDEEKGRLE